MSIEKLEYGDFRKFTVSIGLGLIVISAILPWLYLREPFDLSITTDQLDKLTQVAKETISIRQNFILYSLSKLGYVSIFIFISGITIMTIGLIGWKKHQQKIDAREDQKHKAEMHKMSLEEIREKSEQVMPNNDKKATSIINNDSIVAEVPIDYTSSYRNIDNLLLKSLTNWFSNDYNVSNNLKLIYKDKNKQQKQTNFDFILQSKNLNSTDYLIEFKYIKTNLESSTLRTYIFEAAAKSEEYSSVSERNSKVILLIFMDHSVLEEIKNEFMAWWNEFNLAAELKVIVEKIDLDAFDQMSKETFQNLMDRFQ